MLRVQIGGLRFLADRGVPFSTLEPYTIAPGGLTGWWDRPEGVGGGGQREGEHGEHDEQLFLSGRIITLRGQVKSRPLDRAQDVHILRGLGADGGRLRIEVRDDDMRLWAWCRIRKVNIPRATAGHHPEYTVIARAADPRLFGALTTQKVAANVTATLVNDGNFPADPRFIVEGPQPAGYSIFSPDESSFQVDSPLAAGKVDVVNFADRTVTRDGVRLKGGVSFPRVWQVPGGGAKDWSFGGTGPGPCTAELSATSV